jgi:hypothetical protein
LYAHAVFLEVGFQRHRLEPKHGGACQIAALQIALAQRRQDVGGTTGRCVGCDREGVARQQMLAFRDRERVLKLHPSGRVGRHGHGLQLHIGCADQCVDSDAIQAPQGVLVGKVKRDRAKFGTDAL